jgi:RNA-binding protein YlmH
MKNQDIVNDWTIYGYVIISDNNIEQALIVLRQIGITEVKIKWIGLCTIKISKESK